jgi:large subunit ribosomal protein L24
MEVRNVSLKQKGPAHLHVKTGDTVKILSGKDRNHIGKITTAIPREGKVIVEGAAKVKRHQKARGQGMPGGIIEKEAAIHACKVMLICPNCKKPTRVAHKFLNQEGQKPQKVRACKKCGAAIDS